MTKQQELATRRRDEMVQVQEAPVYEIRVRGRLDGDHWAEWFDSMTVTVRQSGETVIRGPVADQAALYGMLSRLRDLALPLIEVRVLRRGRREKSALQKQVHRARWMMALVYALVVGGLSTLTVFLTGSLRMDTALALTLLFAAAGGLAYLYGLGGWGRGWTITAIGAGMAAGLTLVIYLMINWLPVALGVALLLFALAAGAIALMVRYRGAWFRRPDAVEPRSVVEFTPLTGERGEPSPAERDRAQPGRDG